MANKSVSPQLGRGSGQSFPRRILPYRIMGESIKGAVGSVSGGIRADALLFRLATDLLPDRRLMLADSDGEQS